MNVEQASKQAMREPTRLRDGEGRRRGGSERHRHPFGTAGVVTLARGEEEEGSNMGSPVGDERDVNGQPARDRSGRQGGGEARSTGEAG